MLVLKAVVLAIVGLTDIVFSFLVLARNRKKINNLSFFALAFSMGGWTIGIAGFLLTNSSKAAFEWAKVYYFFPLLVAASLIIFTLTFPNRKLPPLRSYSVLVGFLVLAIPLIFIHTFVTSRLIYHSYGKQILLNQTDYIFYSLYLLVCFSGSLYVMYRKAKAKLGLYSAQAELFFAGFLVAAFFGTLFNLLLPGLGNYRLIWAGPIFTSTFITAIAFSIVRHKMFNIRLAVARTLGYGLSIVVLASGYGFVIFGVAELFFGLHFSIAEQVFLSAATGLAALLFPWLKKFFDRLTNQLFYQDAYDPQVFIGELNGALASTIDIQKMLDRAAEIIARNFKAEYCLFGIKETNFQPPKIIGTIRKNFSANDMAFVRHITPHMNRRVILADDLEPEYERLKNIMQANNMAALAGLAPKDKKPVEGLGYIMLGQKLSGNPYTSKDIELLDTIAKELLIAVQNALHFEEIQLFNVTLQKKVDDATRQLKASNEKLKALDQTKDDFISMASHQLRTPLTSIKGYLSMVLEGDAGEIRPHQREFLGQAFASSQRMVFLIADLLNVSRLKTGKFLIEPTAVNLADMVSAEIGQLREAAQARTLSVVYDKPEQFPLLNLDETKTRQVVMNFLDNAIYYTPPGGKIEIKLADNQDSIELKVSDNGIGVPKHEQHHLFTKFYRAGNAQKIRPDGTGLGLFMAQKVIVAEGGAIIFTSQEGKGSTFGFSFPKANLLVANPPLTTTAKTTKPKASHPELIKTT